MGTHQEPSVFIVKQADIPALFQKELRLEITSGSLFYTIRQGGAASSNLKKTYASLLADPEFLRAARILAQPDLYVTVRAAGIKGLTELRLHRRKDEGAYVAAAEAMEDGGIAISVFDDYRAYLDRWARDSAGTADETAVNYLPPKIRFGEFLLALHAIDSFRLVSYRNMLDHAFMERTYIKTAEFTQSMADSIRSLDIRWLLPAFLAVTPGAEECRAKIDPKDLAVLMEQDFLVPSKLSPGGEDILYFGEAGQLMGVEFLRSWFSSFGFEIQVAEGTGFTAAERLFIAPTLLSIRLVRLETAEDGGVMVNHQAYTTDQLMQKLDELFGAVFAAERPAVPTAASDAAAPSEPLSPAAETSLEKPAEETAPAQAKTPPAASAPAGRFCWNCGHKLSDNAAFCANCGAKVK
ncbi:MAG TPA: zinc-ribbon domain-containing protein [Oscillospiraceae bacterium]|nr:zinc-ribbon domain-containing protein [Oscillospiraceae bacterium]